MLVFMLIAEFDGVKRVEREDFLGKAERYIRVLHNMRVDVSGFYGRCGGIDIGKIEESVSEAEKHSLITMQGSGAFGVDMTSEFAAHLMERQHDLTEDEVYCAARAAKIAVYTDR